MNPSVDVGARRDPLGICAWRSIAHRILVRVELPFILHWFKYRFPRHHQPGRPAFIVDAREIRCAWQEESRK